MVLSGHQPNYWPYPGLIGKIMRSDKFIYVTKVQFEKKSWQKRNRIRTKEGWTYIQVPTITKGKFEQNICDVKIDNSLDWRQKHWRSISLVYGKAPFFSEYKDFIEDLYLKNWSYLSELDIYIMNFLLKELNVTTQVYYDKDYEFSGSKTDLLVDMCRELNCDTYLSNLGSASYVEINKFVERGMQHQYIDYKGCEYQQQFRGYEPNLSILDMLLNCGKEKTCAILCDENNYSYSKINQNMVV